MNSAARIGLILVIACSCLAGERVTTITVGDREFKAIHDVHLNPDGRVIILYGETGVTLTDDKLPDSFLESWGIQRTAIKAMKIKTAEAQIRKSQDDFDKAVAAGLFREADGIVYDLRKPQPEWKQFSNTKVFQIINDGALVDPAPNSYGYYSDSFIFVSNLPRTIGDRDRIAFMAKQSGTFECVTKAGDRRTVRAYDFGHICKRDEIPDDLVSGALASAKSILIRPRATNALAKLPDNNKIKASGSGFFITEDGYLITNHHVVDHANAVKVKTKTGVFPAQIVKDDAAADLALLKISGNFKPLSIIAERDAQLGESAFTIGFPNIDVQGVEPKYTDGKISSLAGLHDDPSSYQISVPVQPGNSGGALVNSQGAVCGVVVAKLNEFKMFTMSGNLPQNVNYAIKAGVLRDFLKSVHGLKLAPARQINPGQVISAAEDAAAMVLIY